MNKTCALCLVFLALTASCLIVTDSVSAEAKTIVVPDDFPTITAAISSALDGDTILVKKGTYHEAIVIQKALTIKGEDPKETIITATKGNNNGTIVLIRHDNVKFSGFNIFYNEITDPPKQVWYDSTKLRGIHLLHSNNCTVSENIVSGVNCGIWFYDAHQNQVSNNQVFNNDYGVRVEKSSGNFLAGNNIIENAGGLWLISSSNNTFKSNHMTDNIQNFLIEGNRAEYYYNDCDSSNTLDGTPICYWMNVANTAVSADAECVILLNCQNIKIQNLHLYKNQNGIILVNTQNVLVTNNTIGCENDIQTFNDQYTNITGNTLEGRNAIDIHDSVCDDIMENSINTNLGGGIYASGNWTRILRNNITAAGGIGVSGFYQTVAENRIVAKSWEASLIQCYGFYTNITRNKMQGTDSRTTPSNAISIIDGSNNVFYQNVMTVAYRLRVTGNQSLIANNTVPSISVSQGSGNVICLNNVRGKYDGLDVGGFNNVFYANYVANQRDATVQIGGTEAWATNNTLYHNNFLKNGQQVDNLGGNRANFWDNGSEGNYWSDYNGTDANGDGIGDTPYVIKGKVYYEPGEVVTGQDNYPLMSPFDIYSVAVTLPDWNYSIPTTSPSATPTPPATSSPTPTLTLTPTSTSTEPPSTSTSPAPSPTIPYATPTDSKPQSATFPTVTIIVIVVAAAVIATTATVLFKLRKRE